MKTDAFCNYCNETFDDYEKKSISIKRSSSCFSRKYNEFPKYKNIIFHEECFVNVAGEEYLPQNKTTFFQINTQSKFGKVSLYQKCRECAKEVDVLDTEIQTIEVCRYEYGDKVWEFFEDFYHLLCFCKISGFNYFPTEIEDTEWLKQIASMFTTP